MELNLAHSDENIDQLSSLNESQEQQGGLVELLLDVLTDNNDEASEADDNLDHLSSQENFINTASGFHFFNP